MGRAHELATQSQTVRQWLLLRTLSADARGATVKRLAADLGVSQKTIRRDVSELKEAGFAIEERTEEFNRKTFVLDATRLPPLAFTYDEVLALYVCRSAAVMWTGTLLGESLRQAFRKIRATLPAKTCEILARMESRVIKRGPRGAYAGKGDLIDALQVGLEDCVAVRITYRSERAAEPAVYDVHPLSLVDAGTALYVVGRRASTGEIRTWKLDRVERAEATREKFERPADFDAASHLAHSFGVFHSDGAPRTVRVRIASSAARYARERHAHDSQRVEQQPDGSVIVEWQLSNTVEVRGYILSFGAAAEVLEPADLREEVREEIDRMKEVYGNRKATSGRAPRPHNNRE